MVKLPTLLLASWKAILMPFTMVSVWALAEPVRGRLETILMVFPWLPLGWAQAASATVSASPTQAHTQAGPIKRDMAPSAQWPHERRGSGYIAYSRDKTGREDDCMRAARRRDTSAIRYN